MEILLIPLAPEDVDVCAAVAAALLEWVGVRLVVPPPLESADDRCRDGSSGPFEPEVLVPHLLKNSDQWPLLGVTARELRDCRGNPISGFAERGGRAGVVSYRGMPERQCIDASGPRPWTDLVVWHVLHEIGHLVGLGHCGAAECVMQKHVQLQTTIGPSNPFCSSCETLWREAAERSQGSEDTR